MAKKGAWGVSQLLPGDHFGGIKVKRSSLGLLRVHFSNHQKSSCLWVTLERYTHNAPCRRPGPLTGIGNDGIEFTSWLNKSISPKTPPLLKQISQLII